jgi:nicotinamide-nucleotide adenylyltransferase
VASVEAGEKAGGWLGPRVGRLGMVARWKPVHLGHAAVLEALVARADEVLVGLGSANRYDASNPFTADESAAMIRLVLGAADRVSLVPVPDLGHGPRWSAMVRELFGPLDLFVTANAYVRELLEETYRVVHPVELLPPERRVRVDGAMVRRAMARGEDWRALVPPPVAAYLEREGLVERFRREFGLATLALEAPPGPTGTLLD